MNDSRHKWLFLLTFAAVAMLVGTLYLVAKPLPPTARRAVVTPDAAPDESASSTQPKITWSPSSVSESVLAGQNKTLSVSFRSSQALSSVAIAVVPELESFVSVEPESFSAVAASQDTTMTLNISTPALLPPTTIYGTIQLRNAATPQETIANPLPVTLNITWSSYRNDEFGFTLNVPPTFISRQSTDAAIKEVTFLAPPATSENDVMILVKISPLPPGQALERVIEQGGIDPTSISQVTLGGRPYLKWFSQGQGSGTLSYATTYSQTQVIILSAPMGSFASSSAFVDVVGSLAVLQ